MMICSCVHVAKNIAFVMTIHIVIGAAQRWKGGEVNGQKERYERA